MSRLPAPSDSGTCLVTGASAGIGAALAGELAARGHGVTLVARREQRLAALAGELATRHGVRAEALPCDLADAGERAELAGRVAELGLRVELLACNAGLGAFGNLVDSDRAHQLEQVRVMGEAVVDLTRAFAPGMAERRRGGVLIVSSGLAYMPMAGYATYAGCKAFALAFGESLRAELRPSGVAVSVLCPGGVRTEFFAANGPQPVEHLLPRPFWQTPDAVARQAVDGLARNRRVVVPGRAMRALLGSRRLLPRGALLWAMARAAPASRR